MDSAVDSVLKAEIDVEVGLRQRILDVLQSRLDYALLLRSTIASNTSSGSSVPGNLHKVIEECLQTLEAPLTPLVYSRAPTNSPSLPQPSQPRANTAKAPNVKGKFLYVNMPSKDGETKTFLLRCPTCFKTSFVSLQGLLNHGRLVHKEEYATHDSCIAHCAIPFEKALLPSSITGAIEEGVDILRLGTQVGSNMKGLGILPGLQRLFEMAVGVDGVSLLPRLESNSASNVQEAEGVGASTVISKTLGHHVETPALAPFLGKKAKRRGITTYEEDSVVDIDGAVKARKVWKKPRRERRPRLEENISALTIEEPKKPVEDLQRSKFESENLLRGDTSDVAGSRFYNTARVALTDWSMWLPPERDNPGMYAWMITLDSPSYTMHHTAYLTSMTVTSYSPITPSVPPSVTRTYPFFVRGYTSQPFLARIRLGLSEINGVEQNMILEHWIDIDPLKTGNPTVGDEQIIDLDLDRRIILREPLKSLVRLKDKARFKTFWFSNHSSTSLGAGEGEVEPVKMKVEEDWEYEKVLRELLPEFPMTLKDFKPGGVRAGARRSVQASRMPKVPYQVLPTPGELLSLVVGKRKAIEWARAKALATAYAAHTSDQPSALRLAIGDVYRWLEDEGEFPRVAVEPVRPTFQQMGIGGKEKAAEHEGEEAEPETGFSKYCTTCGMHILIHPRRQTPVTTKQGDGESNKEETDDKLFICDILAPTIYSLPMADIGAILQFSRPTIQVDPLFRQKPLLHSPKPLVKTIDPKLTLACLNISNQNESVSFVSSEASEVEERLAPYALLAHIIPSLVRTLIRCALHVADKDREVILDARSTIDTIKEGAKRHVKPLQLTTRFLTVSHVLRGLKQNKENDVTAKLLALISPLGLSTKRGDYSENDEGSDEE